MEDSMKNDEAIRLSQELMQSLIKAIDREEDLKKDPQMVCVARAYATMSLAVLEAVVTGCHKDAYLKLVSDTFDDMAKSYERASEDRKSVKETTVHSVQADEGGGGDDSVSPCVDPEGICKEGS